MAPLSVLYVDDEEDLLTIGRIFLEKNGVLKVDTAISGMIAMEKLESCTYDVVISDYQMPKMNGIELLIELKKKYPDIPFILFTGRGREEIVIQAINNGADFYLQKGGEPKSQFAELEHKTIQAAHHRHAEKALIESELLSRTLLDATLDAVAIIDRDRRIFEVNEIYARRFGREPRDFSGHLIEELFDTDLRASRIEWINTVIETAKPVRFEDVRGDLFLENSIYPIINTQGEVMKCAIFSRDISERKRTETEIHEAYEKIAQDEEELRENYENLLSSEQQIRKSEERFRSLTENSPDGIMLFDRDLRSIYINPIAEEHTGIPQHEFVGKKLSELNISPDLISRGEKFLTGAITTGKMSRDELMLPSGSWMELMVIPIIGGEQFVEQVLVTARDITGIKKNEEVFQSSYEDLSRSERLLTDIINFAPDATFAIDTEGRVIAWNHAIEEMTGIQAEEILGKDDYEYAVPFYGERRPILVNLVSEDDEILNRYYIHVHREGTSLTAETKYAHPNGKEVYLWGKASTLYNEKNEVTGAIESIRDITRLKNIEQDLRNSQDTFRKFFDHSYDAIFIHDREGRIIDVNNTMLTMYGLTYEEALSYSIQDYTGPHTNAEITPDMYSRVLSGEDLFFTWEARRPKDGSVFDVEVFLTRIDTWTGPVILANVRDITEKNRVQDELRESEERFRSIFDMAPNGYMVMDEEGRYLLVNKAFETLSGYPAGEVIGKRCKEIGLFNPEIHDQMAEILQKNGEIKGFETTSTNKDGSLRYLICSARYIRSKNHQHLITVVTDITGMKRSELALRRKEEQLIEITNSLPGVVYQLYVRDSGEIGVYFVSERSEDLFGISGNPGSFIEMFTARIVDEDRRSFQESVQQAIKTSSCWNFTGRFRKDDGEIIRFHAISEPVRNIDEVVYSGFITVIH